MIGALIAVVVVGGLALLFVVSLAVRRHGEAETVERDWRPTDEVFRDPSTDRVMRVWEDRGDGSRHYVPEP
jgi:uncharacterized membrane protein YqiK